MRKNIIIHLSIILAFFGSIIGSSIHCHAMQEFNIYEKNGYTYAVYKGDEKVVCIPSNITALRSMQFSRDEYLEGVIVPATVRRIDDYAFWQCRKLKYIIFEGDCDYIGESAISGCTGLDNVSAPEGSRQYEYAKEMAIPVAELFSTGFSKKKVYAIKGDKFRQALFNNADEIAWSSSNTKVAKVNSDGTVKVMKAGKATISAIVNGKTYSYKHIVYGKTEDNRLKQIKKAAISRDMSKYQKVKAAHDWLIDNCTYDFENYRNHTIPQSSYSSKGALIKKVAVCQGYALGFKKIMDSLKIPCVVVTGKAGRECHAWNMVKLGGKWYHIDCTWDDSSQQDINGKPARQYTWFLKSTSYMVNRGRSFSYGSYPSCTSTKYDNRVKF